MDILDHCPWLAEFLLRGYKTRGNMSEESKELFHVQNALSNKKYKNLEV